MRVRKCERCCFTLQCVGEVTDYPGAAMMRHLLSISLGLFLAVTAVQAQLPARDQPSKPRAGTGVIRGRVVRADTGEPLRRAQVRMDDWTSGDSTGPAATMTDAEGRY